MARSPSGSVPRLAVLTSRSRGRGGGDGNDGNRTAQDAGVKKLVLVHIGPHLSGQGPMERGIGDIRRIYDGELIFSEELMRIPF